MSSKWDIYSRQGLDIASAASSAYFALAKSSTRLGFSITHRIASSIASVTSTVVDHALFGGTTVTSPVLSSTISTVISLAEQITLAPIHVGEYLTSTSLLAAHSSINVLSVIFPGSSEASFSLASFISLVKREWSEPAEGEHLPDKKFGVTQIARALIAWVALQGVTQEWQENQWFPSLREIHVEEPRRYTDSLRERKNSRVRVTSDIIFPGNKGQIISADIGEAPPSRAQTVRVKSSNRLSAMTSATTHRPRMLATKAGQAEMKATLRRLSKMVLAGYGGASLLFFGVSPHATNNPPPGSKSARKEKLNEEAQLAHAIDASEAEACGDSEDVPPQSPEEYSWWDVLLGRHDQEIFERFAMDGGEKQEEEMKKKMKATAVIGVEHQMPRFWVLTDHSRGQIVLVLRGTMSLNEIAVDLTCDPEEFEPATTSSNQDDGEPIPGFPGSYPPLPNSSSPFSTGFSSVETTPSSKPTSPIMTPFPSSAAFPPMTSSIFTFPSMTQDTYTRRYPSRRSSISSLLTTSPRYHVHSGMLRMAKAMGDVGKPVQVAVMDALFRNPDYELVLCGHSLGAGVAALIGLVSFP
jgi:sn1-specific diacylglycerol lipase